MTPIERLRLSCETQYRIEHDAVLVDAADIALALAVVEAFADYERLFGEDDIAAMLSYAYAVKALSALTTDGGAGEPQ